MKLYKRCDCDGSARCEHPYWYRFWLHGRERRASSYTANRDLAHRIAIKRENHALEGHEKLRKLKTVKLSEHADAYADWAEKTNRSSLLKDRRVLKGFLASVGDRPLDDITAFHVERWKTLRSKEVSQSSVNRELNVIRGCFSRAVEWGRLLVSPMKAVKPYRVDNVRMRVLSPDEIKKLLESCPPALALISRTTLESLPRLSEVLNLRVEDLGPDYATIVQTKNGRTRKVPLTPELKAELVKQAHKSGYIFGQGKDGKPPRQEAISVAFGRLMRAIGLEGVTHHVLRHTGASAMVAAGISLRVVQDIGGWSTLRMLERYAHPSGAEMSRAVRVLTAYTTGTRTGTATKNGNGDPKTADAASAVKSEVTKWRPQRDWQTSTHWSARPAGWRSRPETVKGLSGARACPPSARWTAA
jgi:integrase